MQVFARTRKLRGHEEEVDRLLTSDVQLSACLRRPAACLWTRVSMVIDPATTFAIVGYASCSSIMLVINKVAVHFLPAPGFVLFAQCMSSWIAVKLAGLLGLIDVDELEWPKAKAFFPVAAAFLACIFANIKTLQFANVETFVVFRASTPLVIGIAEWWFMGRELPNARSAAAMLTLCAGAVFYVLTDASFKVDPDVSLGYAWVVVWYVIFSFDQLYIKHAVDTVKMRSNWGRVYYTNLWASILLFWLTLATEPQTLTAMQWTFKPVAALSLSCAAGVAMSYFAFLCRAAVSATSFTVIGNVCKVLAPHSTCRGRLPHRPAALGGARPLLCTLRTGRHNPDQREHMGQTRLHRRPRRALPVPRRCRRVRAGSLSEERGCEREGAHTPKRGGDGARQGRCRRVGHRTGRVEPRARASSLGPHETIHPNPGATFSS